MLIVPISCIIKVWNYFIKAKTILNIMTFLLFSSINERDTVHCSWAWACTTNCLVTCLILLFFSFTHISFLIDYIKGKQLVSAWRNVPHYIKHIQKWFLPLSFYSFYSTQLYWNKRTSWFWYASSIYTRSCFLRFSIPCMYY